MTVPILEAIPDTQSFPHIIVAVNMPILKTKGKARFWSKQKSTHNEEALYALTFNELLIKKTIKFINMFNEFSLKLTNLYSHNSLSILTVLNTI
jgi:hypothetical protein